MSSPTRATFAGMPSGPRTSPRRNNLVSVPIISIAIAIPGVEIFLALLLLLHLVTQLLLGALLIFVDGWGQTASRQRRQQLLNLLKRFIVRQMRAQVLGPLLHAAKFIGTCHIRPPPSIRGGGQ